MTETDESIIIDEQHAVELIRDWRQDELLRRRFPDAFSAYVARHHPVEHPVSRVRVRPCDVVELVLFREQAR